MRFLLISAYRRVVFSWKRTEGAEETDPHLLLVDKEIIWANSRAIKASRRLVVKRVLQDRIYYRSFGRRPLQLEQQNNLSFLAYVSHYQSFPLSSLARLCSAAYLTVWKKRKVIAAEKRELLNNNQHRIQQFWKESHGSLFKLYRHKKRYT